MRWRACGDTAALAEVDDLDAVLALHAVVEQDARAGNLAGLVDLVPASRTLLVRCRDAEALEAIVARVCELEPTVGSVPRGEGADPVVIPVTYDGEDLADVATLLEVSAEEVVARHTGTAWRAAFTGFAPGFAYLVADHDGPTWEVPRRAESRTRVPAGAVGLAGEFSGVYPRSSPGGWQLIGHTDVALWDPDRGDRAALLTPGTPVRFEVAR